MKNQSNSNNQDYFDENNKVKNDFILIMFR